VTDKLRSYGAAKSEIGLSARHHPYPANLAMREWKPPPRGRRRRRRPAPSTSIRCTRAGDLDTAIARCPRAAGDGESASPSVPEPRAAALGSIPGVVGLPTMIVALSALPPMSARRKRVELEHLSRRAVSLAARQTAAKVKRAGESLMVATSRLWLRRALVAGAPPGP
jgi:hypothetical protein